MMGFVLMLFIVVLIIILKYSKPKDSELPVFFENFLDFNFKKKSKALECLLTYRKLGDNPVGSFYNCFGGGRPKFVIKDPVLIKTVLKKDFEYFCDRDRDLVQERDILSYHIINLPMKPWEMLRKNLEPCFKGINLQKLNQFGEISQLAITQYFDQDAGIVNITDFCSDYSIDIIANNGFGLDPADPLNQSLKKITKKIFEVNTEKKMYFLFNKIFKRITKFFNIKRYNKELDSFFIQFVRDILSARLSSNNNDSSPGNGNGDFVDILMKMRSEEDPFGMTIERMAAQFYIYIQAGYEAIQNCLIFCIYEVSKDTQVQQKLFEEISSKCSDNYDLKSLKYLEMVIQETLRMYPAVPKLKRQCTKRYKIPGKNIVIPENAEIIIPVYGIHLDEKNYENPYKFNPYRKRNPLTYLPFGYGPKRCLGMNFARTAVKLMMKHLIRRYSFKINEHSLIFDEYSVSIRTKNPIYVSYKRRI